MEDDFGKALAAGNLQSFSDAVINELINCDILVTVYSEKNIPIKEAQNLWEKKVTSVFVDDPTNYFDYFWDLGMPTMLKPQST